MENRFYETESKIYISYADDQVAIDEHIDDDTLKKQMKQDLAVQEAVQRIAEAAVEVDMPEEELDVQEESEEK